MRIKSKKWKKIEMIHQIKKVIEDDKSIDNEEGLNIKNDENQMSQMKPTVTDIQTFKI